MRSHDTMLAVAGVMAEAYGVAEEEIAAAVRDVRGMIDYPPSGGHVFLLIETAISVAVTHAKCPRDGCTTCEEIANGLVLVMALLRIRLDEQLEQMVDPQVIETAGVVGIGRVTPPAGSCRNVPVERGDDTQEIKLGDNDIDGVDADGE